MQLLEFPFVLLEILFFSYLFFITVYSAVLSIAGLFNLEYRKPALHKENKIAILVPAHKEDAVIYDSIVNLARLAYPKDRCDIFVIAQSLKEETIDKIEQLPVEVIPVSFEEPTKVKALNAAFAHIGSYDICVVFDADNFAAQDFLALINQYFNAGYSAVQGQRKPKNAGTKMTVLDGLSEAINNHMVRKGTCKLGGSSAIAGSGFAVEYMLLKKLLAEMDAVGGFDKELEIKLLQNGIKTAYAEEAVVYDEKVQDQEVFREQRKRWLASQYFYLQKYLNTSLKAFWNSDFVLFNSAFLRYAQLPRFLNIGLFFVTVVAFYIIKDSLFVPFIIYFILFVLFGISVLFAIPRSMYTIELLKAALALPKVFVSMFLLLFKLKGANKKFIHTPHNIPEN